MSQLNQQMMPFFTPSNGLPQVSPTNGLLGGSNWMSNPLLQMGLGILANNRPGASAGQAIGQGALMGMQNIAAMRQQEEEEKLRRLNAYQMALKMAQAKREQEQQEGEKAWYQKQGFDPNIPQWAAEARYKTQFPGAEKFGTSVHLVEDTTTGEVLPAQASTTGELRLANGQKFDPAKHRYRKPVQFLPTGDQFTPVQPVTGQIQPTASVVPQGSYPSPFVNQSTGVTRQLPASALAPGETISPESPYQPITPSVPRGGIPIRPKISERPEFRARVREAETRAAEETKSKIESMRELRDLESRIPRLISLVSELSKLGQKATYTKTGQMLDSIRRQTGRYVGEGAIARKEYISKVDNAILPLLKLTFGTQFTQKEGESLRATLGDPDAAPEEKDAVLRSFISTKMQDVNTRRRRAELPEMQIPEFGEIGSNGLSLQQRALQELQLRKQNQ